MSDLCAPIMVVMENEVDAFWCFAGFMDIIVSNFFSIYWPKHHQLVVLPSHWFLPFFIFIFFQGHNFELDQAGMKDQLRQLNLLLKFLDPQLHNHLGRILLSLWPECYKYPYVL